MPTRLPARDPLRPLPIHRTRGDRRRVYALMALSALLTLGVASVSHTTTLQIVASTRS